VVVSVPEVRSRVLDAVRRHAAAVPAPVALIGEGGEMSYALLAGCVQDLAGVLAEAGVKRLGVALDNGAAWIVADLAAIQAGVIVVPLPPFFTLAQRDHAIRDAGVDHVLLASGAGADVALDIGGEGVVLAPVSRPTDAPLHAGTAKVTYTSGTTGAPKGVCLSLAHLEAVAAALAGEVGFGPADRHLCVLPLATLLENVGGVYAPLLGGATVLAPRLAALGLSGSSGLDPGRFATAFSHGRPTTAILVPQMLNALVVAAEQGAALPESLRFVAVGGARVAADLLQRAAELQLPVYQGYGLSECASVVALNRRDANRPGSVGRALPHVAVDVAGGEIVVRGGVMLGYAGSPEGPAGVWRTGDVGHVDEDGFLHITGRCRNVLVSAFGRNVSPEWVESELLGSGVILQAVVFGDARPWLGAIVVAAPTASADAVAAAVAASNARLPDYARIERWFNADGPFTAVGGELTTNGRPRRERILARYAARIESLYTEPRMTFHDHLLTATRESRADLLAIPFMQDGRAGRLDREDYVAFLTEAYHHVKHTLPLLMACGARLPERLEWLRRELTHYVAEETGHQDWILADIAACGGDPETVRNGRPAWPAELMVSYAYDVVARGNPVGFLGMVLVLEGTSTAVATQAANALGAALGLPRPAFTYLSSHGALDVGHMDFYATLVNRLDDEGDRAGVIHAAKRFYRLYGDVFRELDSRRAGPTRFQEAA
jgi:long-subunit acyl-CoA synthetase (AMP-forming)/pyrroloquinoline quinone (PQQ) biosynthesis protein C